LKRPILSAFSAIALPAVALLTGCSSDSSASVIQDQAPPPVAMMPDVHFEDVYGDLKSNTFSGIPLGNGKFATIRSMYAELTSTRLFNENYFAFRSALDDAYAKGIRIVALPGDCTDDGQPINVDGLVAVLNEYRAKGMRFFIAPGNHDPDDPFDDGEAGKNDFLTAEGKEQKVYASGSTLVTGGDPTVAASDQLTALGYEALMTKFSNFGFVPQKEDLYWETPFSSYPNAKYTFEEATRQAGLAFRQFEICKEGEGGLYKETGKAYTSCTSITDASYLVEPVSGLWLMAVDANVFIPNANFNAADPKNKKGFNTAGDAGWNAMVTHKKHVMEWMKFVAQRAKAQGKYLITFSHYPTTDFYANQTEAMKGVFKSGAFQVVRVPQATASAAVAATGIRLHVGGHMHFNGTNDFTDASGNYLANVQAPSLAVYGAAYKVMQFRTQDVVDVQTVRVNEVAHFDSLFPFYQKEYDYLQGSTVATDIAKRWDKSILGTKSYGDFTNQYWGQLSMLRFMGDYWPSDMKEAATKLDGRQMLILSQLNSGYTVAQLKDVQDLLPLSSAGFVVDPAGQTPTTSAQFQADWAVATAKASQLAVAAGLTLDSFSQITPSQFCGDFHRVVYAGELALLDMGEARVKQYKVLMSAFPEAPAAVAKNSAGNLLDSNPVNVPFQNEFKRVFSILKGLGSGKPSDQFRIDLNKKQLINTQAGALSFN